MTSLHPARRSAERFDALVEGGRSDDVDQQTADLLALVGALRSTPPPQARPAFVADLRAELMAAAVTELAPAAGAAAKERGRDDAASRLTITPRRRTGRDRRIGVALGAFAIIGATTSMAVASQGAIPGDALYPVKRVIEKTETGFSVSDQSKGQAMLDNAASRLDEVGELSRADDPDVVLVRQTIDAFTDQSKQGSDLLMSDYENAGHEASITRLHDFTADSMDSLSSLEAVIPSGAKDDLLEAAQVLFTIDQAADATCPSCAGEGVTELPGQLLSSGLTGTDDGAGTVAGGELAGTKPSKHPDHQQSDVKGDQVSGITPPENPVSIPPTPQNTPSDPSSDNQHNQPSDTTTGNTGNDDQGHQGNGNGGKQDKPVKGVDLSPVTDPLTDTVNQTLTTVNDVVDGVVTGVGGLLGGLLNGGQQTPAP